MHLHTSTQTPVLSFAVADAFVCLQVANAAKNCSEIANLCPVDHVLKPSGGLVAANKTWGEAQTQCCEVRQDSCCRTINKPCLHHQLIVLPSLIVPLPF